MRVPSIAVLLIVAVNGLSKDGKHLEKHFFAVNDGQSSFY